jgi:hypothetical protein
MVMNGTQLGTELQSAVQALSDADKKDAAKVWSEVGKAIVNHIKTNGVITPDLLVTSQGPVTGTGKIS